MGETKVEAHAEKLEQLDGEFKEFQRQQERLKASVKQLIQNGALSFGRARKNAVVQTAVELKDSECQTLLEQDSKATQTLKSMLSTKDIHCQTASIKKIYEDYEAEKRREEQRRQAEEQRRK